MATGHTAACWAAVTPDGRFAFVIGGFRIQADGSLTPLPFTAGLPVGANGLASR